MRTGIQWNGTLLAGQSKRWVSSDWPAAWHVVWYVVPTDADVGTPQLEWEVAVQRADPVTAAYWITVTNTTSAYIDFEGRYAVLSEGDQ